MSIFRPSITCGVTELLYLLSLLYISLLTAKFSRSSPYTPIAIVVLGLSYEHRKEPRREKKTRKGLSLAMSKKLN